MEKAKCARGEFMCRSVQRQWVERGASGNMAAKVHELIRKSYPNAAIPEGMVKSAFYNVDSGPRVASTVHSVRYRTTL